MQHKKVEFHKIKIQNFLSYGNDPIEVIFEKGITFVTGYNKDEDDTNGVGKTSLIVESLSFLIFGETYRDITQKLIRNNITNGTCIVEGWLSVNNDQYHITRSLSPNSLILEINGDWETHTKTVPETTKDIIEAIGISKNVFTNTVVMTSKDSMSFLNQKKDAKVKFIEGILGLEAFAEFFKKAKEEFKALGEEKDNVAYQVEQLQKMLDLDIIYMNQADENNIISIKDLEEKIKESRSIQPIDNSEKIQSLKDQKEPLQEKIKSKESQIQLANSKSRELEYDLKQKKIALKSLDDKKTHCPLCKKPYDEHSDIDLTEDKNILKDEIDKLNTQIVRFASAINKCQREVDALNTSSTNMSTEIRNLENEQVKFVDSQKIIDKLINQLEIFKEFKNPFKDKIAIASSELQNKKIELTGWYNRVRLSGIIKEMASPTGVKSLMIKKVIQSFNERINHYMLRLKSPFRIHFDEFFEDSIIHKNGKSYSYDSLSGGEAKRVDFSMLFAFRDIRRIQSNISVNITIMDELFDSALSEKGMFNIIELLKEVDDECYYIVTHRSANIDETGCKIIHLEKENGITRMV